MDFSLSEAQGIFRDSVARFVTGEYSFSVRQRIVAEEPGYLEAHWRRFAELGWLAASLPEPYGGLGGSAVETMLLMEQFGRGLVMTPYLATVVLGGNAVRFAGSEAQRATLLPAIGQGKLKLALAFAEPQSRYDLFNVQTRARKEGEGYTLDGHKSVVLYAAAADKLIVSARTARADRDTGGISLFLIERKAPGVELRSYPTLDGGRASEVRLSGVRVSSQDLLGPVGGALPILEQVVDHAAAAVCSEAAGAMWSIYEQTLAYHKTREQFGQKLGSFQALQHRMVDLYMKCQLAQSMVYEATLNLDDADPRARAKAVSAAKFEIGRYARDVGQEGVQLHGGIGMTWELPIGHYLKRITLIGASFGDSSHHLRRYRSLMHG